MDIKIYNKSMMTQTKKDKKIYNRHTYHNYNKYWPMYLIHIFNSLFDKIF